MSMYNTTFMIINGELVIREKPVLAGSASRYSIFVFSVQVIFLMSLYRHSAAYLI